MMRLPRVSSRSRFAIVMMIALALLAGAATARWWMADGPTRTGSTAPVSTSGFAARSTPEVPLPAPADVVDADLGLRAGPVDVPLELRVPAIGLRASVAAVGITSEDVMDAPMGPAGDPVWDQAFWYRGSAVPGSASTALIAGHVGGPGGRSAAFARIGDLRPGDLILVRDTRSGLDVQFAVTESETYSIDEARDPAVLTRIYGAGPVTGTPPQPSTDGLAHLTLITCAGSFVDGTHSHRLAVFASRVT